MNFLPTVFSYKNLNPQLVTSISQVRFIFLPLEMGPFLLRFVTLIRSNLRPTSGHGKCWHFLCSFDLTHEVTPTSCKQMLWYSASFCKWDKYYCTRTFFHPSQNRHYLWPVTCTVYPVIFLLLLLLFCSQWQIEWQMCQMGQVD